MANLVSMSYKLRALALALPLLLTHAIAVSAQTRYEWVPGSRQARAVPAGATNGYTAPPTNPAASTTQIRGFNPGLRYGRYSQSYATQAQPVQSSSASANQNPAQNTAQNTARSSSTVKSSAVGKSYHFVDTVSVDGMQRQFQVHVPPSYDRSKPIPVVLAFHGLGMNSTMMVGMTGFNPVSDHNGFVVVYGEAVGGRWSDGRSGSGADDIAYVTAMLDKLATRINIDRHRVYACGISNGGFFSQLLACSIPDKIAAAGVVASTMMDHTQSAMQGSRPVPIVFFLGTDDPLLPWADGRTKDIGKLGEVLGLSGIGSIDNGLARYGGLLTVPETVGFWTAHNNCSGSGYTTQEADRDPKDGTRVKKESFGSSANQVVVYTIEGGGHTWPGCPNLAAITGISGKISQDIDASALLWDFFKSRSR